MAIKRKIINKPFDEIAAIDGCGEIADAWIGRRSDSHWGLMAEIELLVSGLGSVGGGNYPSYKNDENGRENDPDHWHKQHWQPGCCKISSHDQAQGCSQDFRVFMLGIPPPGFPGEIKVQSNPLSGCP